MTMPITKLETAPGVERTAAKMITSTWQTVLTKDCFFKAAVIKRVKAAKIHLPPASYVAAKI